MLGEWYHHTSIKDGACNCNCNCWGVALLQVLTFSLYLLPLLIFLEASNFPLREYREFCFWSQKKTCVERHWRACENLQFLCVQWNWKQLFHSSFNLIILHFYISNCDIDFISSIPWHSLFFFKVSELQSWAIVFEGVQSGLQDKV